MYIYASMYVSVMTLYVHIDISLKEKHVSFIKLLSLEFGIFLPALKQAVSISSSGSGWLKHFSVSLGYIKLSIRLYLVKVYIRLNNCLSVSFSAGLTVNNTHTKRIFPSWWQSQANWNMALTIILRCCIYEVITLSHTLYFNQCEWKLHCRRLLPQ